MPSLVASRMLLVLGIATIAAGAYGRRVWDVETDIATLGVVALMAVGFFAAIMGFYGVLRQPAPRSERAARRTRILERAAWQATLPPVIGGGLMLAFFGLTDRWERLQNPVASQIALAAGIIGALIGILADRITRWELVLIPIALLVALIGWGDRLPLESKTTSRGEMVALLAIAILLVGIVINIPQIVRGRRRATEAS